MNTHVRNAAILLAAGSSERMGFDKLTMMLGGKSAIERCAAVLLSCASHFGRIVITVSESTRAEAERVRLLAPDKIVLVSGGSTRTLSVYNALRSCNCDVVAIHDAARCLVTADMIDASVESAWQHGSGIVGITSRDTVRDIDNGVMDRNRLFITQTPQTFRFEQILNAYERAVSENALATDDCALFERAGNKACTVSGSIYNQKLTVPEDIPFFMAMCSQTRTGIGEDTHRLVPERKLILGGAEVPFRLGLLGHSDADVLTHAIIDAMLGAAALNDIGTHFPDTDGAYKNICSLELLSRTAQLLSEKHFAIQNIDSVIIAQEPKLAPYICAMQENIAVTVGIPANRVSVKATTPEHTGPEGALECISARAVCTVSL